MAKEKKFYRPRIRDDRDSPQRAWQKRMVAAGNCKICGRPRNLYAIHCDEHQAKKRRQQRKYEGTKAWRPGSTGRPPFSKRGKK